MPELDSASLDPILERTFGWLRDLGFTARSDPDMTVGATFATDAVVVRPRYHWHDAYVDVTIARRWASDPAPYWAQVHLEELLRTSGLSSRYDGVIDIEDDEHIEAAFARGAALLREVAPDQLAGRDLDVLDTIIAKRPRRGVPGLDYPVEELWAASQEGLWFTTDYTRPPPSLAEALATSRSPEATTRATAALDLRPGIGHGGHEEASAFGRLVELLTDPELDVRRAAASSLSEWGDQSVLDTILDLLDEEAGGVATPFAAAATYLAIDQPPEVRQRVRHSLDRFADRGDRARSQVAQLRWRLDDHPEEYPRVSRVWQ